MDKPKKKPTKPVERDIMGETKRLLDFDTGRIDGGPVAPDWIPRDEF